MFIEICPLKICVGDLSLFEGLIMEICPLKIYSGDFSFYEDLSIEDRSVGDLSLFEKCFRGFILLIFFRRFVI